MVKDVWTVKICKHKSYDLTTAFEKLVALETLNDNKDDIIYHLQIKTFGKNQKKNH